MITSLALTMLLAAAPVPRAAKADLAAAKALVARVVPGNAGSFVVAQIPDSAGHDVFEVESRSGKIVLRGSSGVAIASALNWYLENVAGVNVANPLVPIHLKAVRPVAHAVHVVTPYTYRYFFNYCTFSYSMAWWGWDDWQRMIDWMALKGINLPLAATGQEGTWQLVLRDLGFSDRQIGEFLVGPAYLPWGWMGNIDGLGGPLPKSWIASHVALERRILARERALGMKPVLQGFTGHVPESIRDVFPNAKIHQTGDWSAGFSGTWFLDPLDPLFQRIGTLFVRRQTELFGTDHLYAADSFNEINPPTDDSTFLAGMGHTVYESMHAADPEAIWVLQGWFLYYQAKFWRDPQAKALLGAVPDDRMLVLDLYGDRNPVWKERQAFFGKPWIWNVLYNFGGRVALNGDLPHIAANVHDAVTSPARGRLAGLGMMMEGLGYNPIVPDYVMDLAWRDDAPPIEEWAHAWVRRRYGTDDPRAWAAWKILLATAYRSPAQTGTFVAERPQFYDAKAAYRTEPRRRPYDPQLLAAALDTLLTASKELGASDAYRYDVVNLARQVVGDLGLPAVQAVQSAYEAKDRAALARAEATVTGLIADLDTLVGTRREFLLGPWLESAKAWGRTPAERNLYEWNARNIITLWGTKCTEGQNDDLNLYAYKQWQGMFSGYFLPRWKEFFAGLNKSIDEGKPFDRAPFAAESCEWEQRWSAAHERYRTVPSGDALDVTKRVVRRWSEDRRGI
ncbi:MAG TPA: alpha-N-acetylglucosaminidase [Vicinamibacterales bacterium]|nr:alpha-N-acetylglucosaminidase [Vicinamibacterales bacterium]